MKIRSAFFSVFCLLIILIIRPAADGFCSSILQPAAGGKCRATVTKQHFLLVQSVSDEYSEAIAWYRQLAEEGKADGQFYLGLMYSMGRGLPMDYGKAVMWFLKAAEQGYPDAQFELGRLYAVGNDVEQDIIQAYVLINLAADQGHKKAMEIRGIIARQMDSREMEEARELLRRLRQKK